MSDPFLIPALISGGINAGAQLLQGGINMNEQQKNRDLQVELANTAIQRRQADLAAAGINPLMAGRIGGADTPTVQAPQMTGITEAANELTPNAIQSKSYQMQQQQMTIQQTQAETERINAEKEKALADAALTTTTNEWYGPKTQQEMNLQNSQQQETDARRKTIEALRIPQVNQIVADTAKTTQETKTEQQKTIEYTEMAKNAAMQYKANANNAMTIAKQAADYYNNFFATSETNKINSQDLQIQLMKNDNFKKVIDNVLANDYGRMQKLSEMDWGKLLGPSILGNTSVKENFKVLPNQSH